MKLPIVKYRWIWFAFSGTLVAASIVSLAVFKLNFGVDFTGGSLMNITVPSASTDAVRSAVESAGYTDVRVQPSQTDEYLVRLQPLTETQHQELISKLKTTYPNLVEQQFNFVGPTVGAELAQKALWSIGLVLLLIMIYVAWAFRKVAQPVASWKYGVLTMITAIHDVSIPLGVFAILGHFYGYQVDSAFVAAILTILGYSINDTIVVFDRTRENLLRRSSTESFSDVVNKSVNQTLVRSINTSMTTMLAMLAVFLFGGETTRSFALALIIGILSGSYSSIFIASPLLVVWEGKRK